MPYQADRKPFHGEWRVDHPQHMSAVAYQALRHERHEIRVGDDLGNEQERGGGEHHFAPVSERCKGGVYRGVEVASTKGHDHVLELSILLDSDAFGQSRMIATTDQHITLIEKR